MMNRRKMLSIVLAGMMTASLAACGSSSDTGSGAGASSAGDASGAAASTAAAGSTQTGDTSEDTTSASLPDGSLTYASIELGTTGTDLTTQIKFFTNRTDMLQEDYSGKTYEEYVADFNQLYPNITVNIEGSTDYAEDALLRLQGGDWGDIMLIPAIDASELSNYFIPYGTLDEMNEQVRFASNMQYGGICYGVPTTGNAQGVLYNKKVFEEAGITELPKTPDEFIADLQAIKDNTDAIPLYTNYAAGWTMGAWDGYISGSATGDATYENQKLAYTSNPFADPGDGTHAYNVYKILYDAVNKGLTEDDFTTTDWEGSKGMLNRGEIGTMVLGSWAFSQMQAAGDNPDDIGYMSFPITVDGQQYASAGADYSYGINNSVSEEEQLASMIFVKWMTEKSGFAYNEGGIPIALDDDNWPAVYEAFDGVTYISDEPAPSGHENDLSDMNAESELNVNNGGNTKIQEIVEHAANNDESFDDIMAEWNQKWTDAQDYLGIEVQY